MINLEIARKAWAILDPQERRSAFMLLAIVVVSALASAVMVGSVFPFLSLLADPSLIQRSEALAWVFEWGEFNSEYDFLVSVGVATAVVIFIMNVILFVNLWALTHWAQMRVYTLSRKLLAHYLGQPYEYFLDHHSGDMATDILAEAFIVVTRYLRPLTGLISAVCTILAIVCALMILDPFVTIIALISFAAIYLFIAVATRRGVHVMGEKRAAANKVVYRVAGESLTGIKDIKLLGREAAYLDRFDDPARRMAGYNINVSLISAAPQFLLQVVAFCGIVLLSLLLIDPTSLLDRDALGELLPLLGVLAFAGQRLLPQLHAVYGSMTEMTFGQPAVERVHAALFETRRGVIDRNTPEPLRLTEKLELNEVSYSYPNAQTSGILNVDLNIRAGERIGIIGTSGAGKTTLADIVLGLLKPHSGRIRVDGIEIGAANLRAWQASVGYVPQDIFLTDADIYENIALGLEASEIDRDKVIGCAKIAQLHEFVVSELPDAYATEIGERGVRLSGGQRQRIGIARALYHDADLIVFDEATSALDNLTEREVMASIEALPGDKTILMIAHRLSTVKVCDRIIVMEKGEISGVGDWDALAASNQAFRRIAQV